MRGRDDVARAVDSGNQIDVCGFWRTLLAGAVCLVVAFYAGFLANTTCQVLVADTLPGGVLDEGAAGIDLGLDWLHRVEDTGRSLAGIVQAFVGVGFLYFVVRPRCLGLRDYFGPLLPPFRLLLKYALCLFALIAICSSLAVIVSLLRGKGPSVRFSAPASATQLPLWLVAVVIAVRLGPSQDRFDRAFHRASCFA